MLLILAFNVENRMLWAVLIGWILTVVLHEFAHGLVASWGGDYTIRERGGLSLNPLQYVDPMMSLIFPAIILLLGGVPLPGGATFVRRDLLRSRFWDTAVSLAGPGMNLLLFAACALALHPSVGWLDPTLPPEQWSAGQIFLGTMAVLQLFGVVLNLVPVPPLDGFQALAPYLPADLRDKLSMPPISTFAFFGYVMVLWNSEIIAHLLMGMMRVLPDLGYGHAGAAFFVKAYRLTFSGGA